VFHGTSTLHKPVPGTAQEDNEVASVSEWGAHGASRRSFFGRVDGWMI
jgi:hypothetical protein